MKLLAYLTTDLVNASTVESFASQHCIPVQTIEPRDLTKLDFSHFDLILDWDYIPDEIRVWLMRTAELKVVAIHGYGVSDSLAGFLPRRGVFYSPKLTQHFLFAISASKKAA